MLLLSTVYKQTTINFRKKWERGHERAMIECKICILLHGIRSLGSPCFFLLRHYRGMSSVNPALPLNTALMVQESGARSSLAKRAPDVVWGETKRQGMIASVQHA